MILAPTNRRIIRPGDKPSFEHTQRYGLIKDHPLGPAGGLVFFPIMNEGSGPTILDLSGNGNDGTLTNGPIWQPGKSGSCIDFGGGDDEIYRSVSNALSGNTGVTIIARVKREGAGGDNAGRIFTFGPENDYEYILYDNDGASTFDFNRARVTTTGRWQLDYSGITTLNTWIDWAVTYDGSSTGNNPKFYANAVPMTSINESTAPDGALKVTGTPQFTIGNRHSDSVRGYNGKIEFIYIYNCALSTSEIASVYWNPFCMVEKKTAPVYFFVPSVGEIKEIAGVSVIESTTSGTLSATRELAGTSVISSTTGGILKATREIIGTTVISSTTASVLKASKRLAGTSVIESTTTGSVKLTQELISTSVIASTATGELVSPERELAGTVAIETTTAGDLTRTGTQELVGVVAILSTASGTLTELIGGFSNYAENGILELITGKTPLSKPSVYLGFCITDPGEEATGADCNEVTDTNGYGRVAVAADDWNSASGGTIDNINKITSPYATGSWGVVTHYILVDSPTYGQGNVLVYDALDNSRSVEENDALEFAAGELSLTLD